MPSSAQMDALFAPRSVAVIGASDDPSRIGGRPLRILAERGFEGTLYPVNPKYDSVQGLKSYRSIDDLPTGIDLYIVCVSSDRAVDVVEAAAARGAGAAIVFSGGFAEVGAAGQRLQERLSQVVQRTGLALVGPNSLGLASFVNNSFGTFATALATVTGDVAGNIAIVSQSGGMAFNMLAEAFQANARFSHVIATGNEAGLGFADYLDYLADDPATHAVIGYVEGVSDGTALGVSLQRLREAGKPVFLLKTGVSDRGRSAVATHTAQMSGNDDAFEALFDRYGAVRLHTIEEAIDVARALSLPAEASGLAIATNSGGTATYLADVCDRYEVPLVELGESTRTDLREQLPDFAAISNPVDFTAQILNDRSLLERTIEILDRDPAVDVLLVFLGSMGHLADELWDILERLDRQLRNPMVISWLGVTEEVRTAGIERGLNVSADPARILRGLGLVRQGRCPLSATDPVSTGGPYGAMPVEGGTGTDVARSEQVVDEWETMRLLDREAIPTPMRRRVVSETELRAAAEAVGYPCVLKMITPVLAHRATVGAVKLDLRDDADLATAYGELVDRHGMTAGMVAQQCAIDAELIVGALRDETFGTRAVVGLGGVWANAINDRRGLVPPYSADYVLRELRQLQGAAWLIRSSALGLEQIAEQVAHHLSSFERLIASPDNQITDIECNPVAITAHGVLALDALAFTKERTPQ